MTTAGSNPSVLVIPLLIVSFTGVFFFFFFSFSILFCPVLTSPGDINYYRTKNMYSTIPCIKECSNTLDEELIAPNTDSKSSLSLENKIKNLCPPGRSRLGE